MNLIPLLLCGGVLLMPCHFARAQSSGPIKGRVCFQTDFESARALDSWSGKAKLESGYASSNSVVLESGEGQRGATISTVLPVDQIRGCTLRGTAMVRADHVSAKPNPWNGIKYMLVIESPSGNTYPQAPVETGTFDWRRIAFSAHIPTNATRITLVLGLESVTGKVGFDNLRMVISRPPAPVMAAAASGPMFTGHAVPRLRGVMISPGIDAESLRVLGADWGANLIRWQLIRSGAAYRYDPKDYDVWLEGELKKLDAMLPVCEQYGLFIALDLHSPPGGKATSGGYVGSDSGLFTDKSCQDKLVEVWQKIATRYKGKPMIWGYDIANEPVEDDIEEGCDDWQELAERTARAIRVIDPERAIIVEPANWGDPGGLKDFTPLSVSNVVYSVHMYLPHTFTHQRLNGTGPAYSYPGVIAGKSWDKAELERALQPTIDFQKRYNVQIYIGEFSAIRWAPDGSACRYLSDVIDILEDHGWDWSYHAFREWQGWSVEHGTNPADTKPVGSPTDRQKLLCRWFGKNVKATGKTE